MKRARYALQIAVVGGRIDRNEVDPPFTEKENRMLDEMIACDKELFEKSGRHAIFEVPFGVFDEDYENREYYASIYNESIEECIERMDEMIF